MKTYKFDENQNILWSDQVDENTHQSGIVWKDKTKTREISEAEYDEEGNETKAAEFEEYSPYQELIDSGVEIEPYDPDGSIAAEQSRQEAKRLRDKALQEITFDLGNGKSIQCRESDEIRIRRTVDRMKREDMAEHPWIATDNTMVSVTVEQLEQALIHGENELANIFAAYMEATL